MQVRDLANYSSSLIMQHMPAPGIPRPLVLDAGLGLEVSARATGIFNRESLFSTSAAPLPDAPLPFPIMLSNGA